MTTIQLYCWPIRQTLHIWDHVFHTISQITSQKNERSQQDDMWHDICSATKTLASNALSFMLRSVKNRQVGAVEAADRLLGYKLFSKSRQLRFADLQRPEKVKRVLKPIHELKNIVENNPDSRDIFHPHWVLDIYPDRPDELETTSLYDLLGWLAGMKRSGFCQARQSQSS